MSEQAPDARRYVTVMRARLNYPAAGLFLIAFALYLYTLSPSVNWGDGARLQMDVIRGGSTYWYFDEARRFPGDGLPFDHLGVAAWDHPLYVLLGQVFVALPMGEPAYRVNLFSAVAASVAVALLYRVGEYLTGIRRAAALGSAALAVSHTFWFHAVTAKEFALQAVFMLSLIWLTIRLARSCSRRDLMLFALLSGLGLANSIMLCLTVAPAVMFIVLSKLSGGSDEWNAPVGRGLRRSESLRRALATSVKLGGLFLLGLSPWLVQFVRMAQQLGPGPTIEVALDLPWLLVREAPPQLTTLAANLAGYGLLLLYQFTPLGVAFGAYGCAQLWQTQRSVAALLSTLFLLHAAFSANYAVPDRFAFHFPSYVVFALFIVAGIAGLLRALGEGRLIPRGRLAFGLTALLPVAVVSPVGLYALTPPALHVLGLNEADLGAHRIGTGARDAIAYFLNPNKRGDESAVTFGHTALSQLAPDAVVFVPKTSDLETFVVLRYFQSVERLRPDVRLELMLFASREDMPSAILDEAHSLAACRPLYLASLAPRVYPLSSLRADFDIIPEANLYRLRPRQGLLETASLRTGRCSDTGTSQAGLTLQQLLESAAH